jgi:hypothetical protein
MVARAVAPVITDANAIWGCVAKLCEGSPPGQIFAGIPGHHLVEIGNEPCAAMTMQGRNPRERCNTLRKVP